MKAWLPRESLSSILVIGSGGIKIAEAAEFDYSGSQALKAIKEEGIKTVLVNPNIATIQTSYVYADRIYAVPITPEYVERVIERERPDGIMIGFGGQTALSVGVALWREGVLHRYSVKVLGTPISGIETALERGLFREAMSRNNIPVPPSMASSSPEEAFEAAEKIGYPVIVRVSFNLGGGGSFVAWKREELREKIYRAFAHTGLVKTVLVEKYLHHWKEIEYEIMRDRKGNSVSVACMENMDPMGIHTGDSIVIAPCQTLTNREYYIGRDASKRVADVIGLIGECNVQIAFDPYSERHYVIETNPRMSRSSALASKATGYPLAYIAAKLAMGYTLDELINRVTLRTSALFEPSLDYIVVKIPRWDLEKFVGSEPRLGSEMMSVGEVMAIGRTVHEALQKAFRMLDIGEPGIVGGTLYNEEMSLGEVLEALEGRKPYWPLWAAKAFKMGVGIDEIHRITGVDRFFLRIVRDIVDLYEEIRKRGAGALKDPALIQEAKIMGFSDAQIARAIGVDEDLVRTARLKLAGLPSIKRIDTLAAEWPAQTNYLYATYGGYEDDVGFSRSNRKILVIGPGGFRIGVSVEFDWAAVSYSLAARSMGYEVAMINYNPETVSTDWDLSDKLYFEEVSVERILDIYEKEGLEYVVVSVGGQIGNNIAKRLEERGLRIAGTPGWSIDVAEDRAKFSSLLDKLGIDQPLWYRASSVEDALRAAREIGYPVIVRPSYVLSGTSMSIAYSDEELRSYLTRAVRVSREHSVTVSQFIADGIEAEIDAVSDGKGHVVGIAIEHIERAGVHSGDAMMVIPPRRLGKDALERMKEIALRLARELSIRGLYNIQYIIKNGRVYVIELNLRASRSMPFSSKAKGINLAELAAKATLGSGLEIDEEFWEPPSRSYAIKTPQFSWARIREAYPFLGPEMRSTGEVACLGESYEDALIKSWLSATPNKIPSKGILIYSYVKVHQKDLGEAAEILSKYYTIYTLEDAEIPGAHRKTTHSEVRDMIIRGEIDLAITNGYTPEKDYRIRRTVVDMNIPIILHQDTALEVAKSIKWLLSGGLTSVKEMREYENQESRDQTPNYVFI
jgi:carbamoyl-phosphate synthase large subunit